MNELLSYVISGMFQSLASTIILKSVDNQVSKKDLIKFYFFVVILNIISGLYIRNDVRFVYTITVLILIFYFLLKIKNKKAIIYSLIIMTIIPLSEIIVTLLMVIIGIKSNIIIQNSYFNLIANIVISLLSIIIINIPVIKKIILKINNFFTNNNKSIYYLICLISVLYFLILKNGLELLLKSTYYINIIIVLGILIMFVLIMFNDIKAEQLKEINKQSMNYISKYEKIITEQGKANHEFKNQLMVIKGYAKMNSPKLLEYLDSIIEDSNKAKSTYLISQLNKFPDGGIKGLLYYKLSVMEDKKIRYTIYSDDTCKRKAKKLSTEQMKSITKILGVVLDNAVEAANKSKTKEVDISLTSERGKIIFNISNTYTGKIKKEKLGTGFTTKGKGHGYGLRLIKDILKNNDYIDYENKIEDKLYSVILIIKTKNL